MRLVQVRTLAEAGVLLAEIGAMLDADPDRFAANVADVERRLTERIEELVARRDMLHRLAGGNRLLLPERACTIVDRATELGFHPDYLARVREGLVLAKALIPEFDGYLTQIEYALDDARYMALLKRWWDARAWEPDDPRVGELATAATDHLLANPELMMHHCTPRSRLASSHEGSSTRVELEQRPLQRYGDRAGEMRGICDSPGSWTGLLQAFADRVPRA